MLRNGKSLDFKRFSGIEKAHRNSIEITVGFMAESKGFFRRTPVCLRVASLLDHVGKNSPPDCFLPQTSLLPPCSNPSFCFANAKSRPCDLLFVLSMGYEKDIFGSFAYDFELSQKLIFG